MDLAIRHIQEGLDFSDMAAVEEAIYEATGVRMSLNRYLDDSNFYLVLAESIIF